MPDDGGSAGTGSDQGQGGVQATLFTQEQVNHFNAEAKRNALSGFFKELGFDSMPSVEDLKGTLSKAGEFDKLQQGQVGDVERLTTQLSEANKKAERLPGLEADYLRAQLAADAGLKSRYWKYVEGKTEDEIKASVAAVLADVGSQTGDGTPPAPTGRPPEPNPQQGRGGGQPAAKTLQSGVEAYRAKHKKE